MFLLKNSHILEYVPGEDLKNSIRRFGQLLIGKSIAIAIHICEGLSEAHRLGVSPAMLMRQLTPKIEENLFA